MDAAALRARIEEHVRRHDLILPGGEVACLVSGGADSTCLWHALGALGYRVSALHVNHGLRGEESEADARFCAERLGAEVVEAPPAGRGTEAELREPPLRAARRAGCARPGHTASDQVETILYRLASSGTTTGIRVRRDDGVVRPLLTVWREETEAYCQRRGPPVPRRLHQPGHRARADPRRDPARAPAAAPGRRAQRPRCARGAANGSRDRSRERC